MKPSTPAYVMLMVLFITSLFSSVVLSLQGENVLCAQPQGCDIVQDSPHASTLGVKNSYLGIPAFLALIALLLFHWHNPSIKTSRLLFTGLILGSLIAFYFLYLQQFVLRAYCTFCLIVDFSILLALVIFLLSPVFKILPSRS